MSNLEERISEWRRQMLAAGIQAPAPLDELECHLREDIELQIRAGSDEARAFELATEHLGQAVSLKQEFKKTGNARPMFLRKLRSFIFGVPEIPFPALDDFEPEAKQTLEFAPEEARHFNHDFIGTEHILLGLTRSGSKTVSNVLQKFGVTGEALRREIEQIVGVGSASGSVAQIPFTPRAHKALQLAVQEAENQDRHHVRAEHVFLGLLREGGGVAALVLTKLGVRLESARAEVLKETCAPPETR